MDDVKKTEVDYSENNGCIGHVTANSITVAE
jgi:hypothetical protein